MSNNNNSSGIWPIVGLLFVIAVIIQMIAGNNNTTSTTSPSPATNSGSFEYRYAKERFKQEGFSNSDAETAARAVIKFHEAQKARGQ
jgi:hypothetical protein